MRSTPFQGKRSATVILLVVLVVAFVVQLLAERYTDFPVLKWFALSLPGLTHGYAWQLITYQFMHGGWLHLLVNCWVIYVFGRELEEALGPARLLGLYLSGGVLGGLVQGAAGVLVGGGFAAPVVGASAGAFALLAAFASLYPDRVLTLLLFFIIPVSLRAKYLLLFLGIITVMGLLLPSGNIAHAAHLGGMLTGLLFARYAIDWDWSWLRLPRLRPLRRTVKLRPVARQTWQPRKARADEELPPEEFLSQEVDPILDKISAQGIQSLTERERRILEAAREKMGRR